MEEKILKIFTLYNDNTKHVCTINIISFILILLIISPLNVGFFSKLIIKIIVVALLLYTANINYQATKNLFNIDNIFSNQSLASIRNNMCVSFLYTFLMIILAIYVFINIFS